jgi:hypothetical protein
MFASLRRFLVFSLLGPALGIASAALMDLIAGRHVAFEEGAFLACMFSLAVSAVTGPVDGYLAHVIPQPLRAPLSAVVGAATAAFLLLWIMGGRPIPSETLTKIALFGAVCMGACSLLSGPSRESHLR